MFNLNAQDDDIYYKKNRSIKNNNHTKSTNINKDGYSSRYESEINENLDVTDLHDGITSGSDTSSTSTKHGDGPICSFHVTKQEFEPKIPRYDSLSNINEGDLLKLNGQSLYLADSEGLSLGMGIHSTEIAKEYEGHYFELLVKKERFSEEYFLKEWESGQTFRDISLGYSPNEHWVIVGYYEKMKQLYLGKKLVSHQYINQNNKFRGLTSIKDYLYSVKTGEKYSPEYHSLWTCVDVSVNTDIYDLRHERTRVVLVLQNDKDEQYYCYLRQDDKHTPDALIAGIFYLEDQSKIIISREEQVVAERKAKEELEKKQQAELYAKRRAQLEKLYKKSDVDLMLNRRVLIGWTKQMCLAALEHPSHRHNNKVTRVGREYQ